jgi:hypothetical protein
VHIAPIYGVIQDGVEQAGPGIMFHVHDLPAGEMGAVDAPIAAAGIRLKDKGPFSRSGHYEYLGICRHETPPTAPKHTLWRQ